MPEIREPARAIRYATERDVVAFDPVVAGGACCVTSGPTAHVICLCSDDMSEMWRQPAARFVPIAVAGDVLLLNSSSELKAVRVETGQELWRQKVKLSTWGLWGDRLVLPDNPIAIVNPQNGVVMESIEAAFTPRSVKISGRYCLGVANGCARYLLLDLVSKQILWDHDIRPELHSVEFCTPGTESISCALGVGGVLVFSFRGVLFGYSVRERRVLWQRRILTFYPPAVTHDAVYVWNQSDALAVHWTGLDPTTGTILYDHDVSSVGKLHRAWTPRVHRRAVVVTTEQGLLCAFAPGSGELLWYYQQTRSLSAPTIVDDAVFVASDSGELLVFSLT